MADLFLELFSEEIPAKLQVFGQEHLKNSVASELSKARSNFEAIESFSTPQRLILVVKGLTEKAQGRVEEKRGPNVMAPEEAVDGFCKSMKIDRSQLFTKDEKKGTFYFARIETFGQANVELIPEILHRVIRNFPWPRSMRWGSGEFKWVRPLRSIVCIFSDDIKTCVLPLDFDGVISNNVSRGHRFLAPGEFTVKSFEDYQEKIRHQYVILDRTIRKEKIWNDASNEAFARGLVLVDDKSLLEEVTGLVEWPVVLIGKIDQSFLILPSEVLRVSMREHQKFFALRNASTKAIESFALVSNILSADNGKRILQGNERVLSARLSDAKFFWENDLRVIEESGYESFLQKLERVTFHNKLGTEADRVRRIQVIAGEIATMINADVTSTKLAASICKLDLVSEMVYEFPELQGVIGQYYAEKAGFDDVISASCYEHYLPRGPMDKVPKNSVAVALALAEKIDLITSFWSINLMPTGSKDPFALRRAAIGIIRILLENELNLSLISLLKLGNGNVDFNNLVEFFNERIKVQLSDRGARADILNSLPIKTYHEMSLKVMNERIWAIQDFVVTKPGKDLIHGYKRALNILVAEQKKEGVEYSLQPKRELLKEDPELALYKHLMEINDKIINDLNRDKVLDALENLSILREPIDNFFNNVKINTESLVVRRNRLCLLNQIKMVMHQVADFSKIDGDL